MGTLSFAVMRTVTVAPHVADTLGGLIGELRCVEIGFLLGFADVFLVANALVAEPVANLRDADAAFTRQFLLRFFARIRIRKVRVEVLVQHFGGRFAEVPTLPSVQTREVKRQS